MSSSSKYLAGIFLLMPFWVWAQRPTDILVPLRSNAVLEHAVCAPAPKAASEPYLTLPFFDDFSKQGPYPQPGLWKDRTVFINNTFPIEPPTHGVATFDGLNESGEIYAHARPNSSFWADTLTSHPLRLDSVFGDAPRALTPADSVYLSFYYQPGGGYGDVFSPFKRGTAPGKSDVLQLEFFNPKDSSWTIVWSTGGLSLNDFCPLLDSLENYSVQDVHYFRQVMIPITFEAYFDKNFRFRFMGKSTISSSSKTSGGQWHVDYVYVNSGRRASDRTAADVAFVALSPSLIKQYTQIPVRQFSPDQLYSDMALTLTNMSAQQVTCHYRYDIVNERGEEVYTSSELTAEVYPFVTDGYRSSPPLTSVPLNYKFEQLQNRNDNTPTGYTVRHMLSSGIRNEFSRSNDTLSVEQVFGTDFACDDGSAEAGWGLNYAHGEVAYPFMLRVDDTLTALRIFFNRSLNDENFVQFNLVIRSDGGNDTVPGDIIYKQEGLTADAEKGLNAFVTYELDKPLVLPAGRFFVGLEQTSSAFLNIGYDQNTVSSGRVLYSYYNTFEHIWTWNTSLYTGALMIRPSFGGKKNTVANEAEHALKSASDKALRVYPNPVRKNAFSVSLPENIRENNITVSLFDRTGRGIWTRPYAEKFSTEGLGAGVYLLKVRAGLREIGFAKIVVL